MGADQSQDAAARCEALMKNEPEESVVVHEDSTAVVMYDPSSMFEAPRKRRISWRDLLEFNASCKKRLVRATRGASRMQLEENQAEQCVELPLEIYSKAKEVLSEVSCHQCSFVAASPSDFLRHERTHSGEKPFTCGQCNQAFSERGGLRRHNKRTHIGEKPFACDECAMAFSESGDLRKHKRTHSGEKPFACDECDQTFAQIGNLIKHKRTHTGEKPYTCGQCGQAFSTSHGMHSHEMTHSGEKPYTCGHCGQTFAHSSSLRSHERTHSGERPYECGLCEQTFVHSSSLLVHKRFHSGEKPFTCEQCDQTFAQLANLLSHKRTHSGDKPFKCGGCGKGFSQSSARNTHERLHTGEKPFLCGECGKGFSNSGSMRKHERLHTRPSDFPCPYQDHSSKKYTGEGLSCETFCLSATSLGFHIRKRHDKEHKFKMPAELAVREELKQTFGEAMQHDWQNYMSLGSCESVGNSSYRFDFRTPAPEGSEMLVVTEVDEFQHRRYPCDLKRMLHAGQILMQEFLDTPIVFVRWNPDPRKIGAVHFNVPLKERVKMLMRVLQNEAVLEDGKKMSDLVSKGLNVIYMYYDLERAGGALDTRVCMLNGVVDENADNSATVRSRVIAAM